MKDPLCIVLLTYADSIESPRHIYAMDTLVSALENIEYDGKLLLHIADDGSGMGHLESLLLKAKEIRDISVTISNASRSGYGASFNLATQTTHLSAKYHLLLEDDWKLTRPLNLTPLTDALDEGLNCIRLGYLGWTQDLRGKLVKFADQTFLELDPDSEETHVWSGHPRLETTDFQVKAGPWAEGVDPGTTEFLTAVRKSTRNKVAWPMDLGIYASQHFNSLFVHIGAVQAREDQHV